MNNPKGTSTGLFEDNFKSLGIPKGAQIVWCPERIKDYWARGGPGWPQVVAVGTAGAQLDSGTEAGCALGEAVFSADEATSVPKHLKDFAESPFALVPHEIFKNL